MIRSIQKELEGCRGPLEDTNVFISNKNPDEDRDF